MSYNTNNIKGWGCFGLWVWVLVQSFLSYLIYGYVFSMLWNWFVVPFLGLPSLNYCSDRIRAYCSAVYTY